MFTGRERRQSKACSFFVLRPSELWAGAVHASLPLRYPAVSLLSFSGSGHRLHIQARRLTRSHGLFGYLAALCRGVEVSVELQVTVLGRGHGSSHGSWPWPWYRSLLFRTCPPTRLIPSVRCTAPWAPPTSVRHCSCVPFQCSSPIFLSGILRSESDLGTCRTVNCLSDSGSPTPLAVSQFVDISHLSNISAVGSSSTGSGTRVVCV